MRDLELILSGPEAEDAVAQLAAVLGDAEIVVSPRQPREDADTGRKAVDPVAVAALLVSIPGAALAVLDLADRLAKRRRAKALIEAAGRIRIERRAEVMAVTAEGPVALADLDPDALLALVDPGNRAGGD